MTRRRMEISALRRRMFVRDAAAARAEALTSGEGFAAADVQRYIAARVRGECAQRPQLRRWR